RQVRKPGRNNHGERYCPESGCKKRSSFRTEGWSDNVEASGNHYPQSYGQRSRKNHESQEDSTTRRDGRRKTGRNRNYERHLAGDAGDNRPSLGKESGWTREPANPTDAWRILRRMRNMVRQPRPERRDIPLHGLL